MRINVKFGPKAQSFRYCNWQLPTRRVEIAFALREEEINMAKLAGKVALAAAAIFGLGLPAWAEDFDVGRAEYRSSCAACHGIDGKGKGSITAELKVAPPDLTGLAKQNGGVFPLSSVYEVIDGRKVIIAHGTRDMPVWGWRFSPTQLEQSLRHYTQIDPEYFVRMRILAVIDYLNRIQEK
jgi:mono/diheme cytochrome c family protein